MLPQHLKPGLSLHSHIYHTESQIMKYRNKHGFSNGGHQATTVEGKDNIIKACSYIWNGRYLATPANQTMPEVAGPHSPHGASSMPKQTLFSKLEKKRPRHETKRRWHDVAVSRQWAMMTASATLLLSLMSNNTHTVLLEQQPWTDPHFISAERARAQLNSLGIRPGILP